MLFLLHICDICPENSLNWTHNLNLWQKRAPNTLYPLKFNVSFLLILVLVEYILFVLTSIPLTAVWIQFAGGCVVDFTASSMTPSLCSKPGQEHMEKPPTVSTPGMKKSTLRGANRKHHHQQMVSFTLNKVMTECLTHDDSELPWYKVTHCSRCWTQGW